MNWRSIHSAPQDGTRVLVRYRKGGGFAVVQATCDARGWWRMLNGGLIDPEDWKPIVDETIRAAEIRGMRRGFEIASRSADPYVSVTGDAFVDWNRAERALSDAIEGAT